MLRSFILVAIAILAFSSFIGCSESSNSTSIPLSQSQELEVDSSRAINCGVMNFDLESQTVSVTPDRETDFHYKITGFMNQCPGGCLKIQILSIVNKVFTIEVTIENPTAIQVWDVRAIFQDTAGKEILNPDGFTDYYTDVVFLPYLAFAKEYADRAFPIGPGATDSEILKIDFTNATSSAVYYIIEASIGGPLQEPYQINKPYSEGVYLSMSPRGGRILAEVMDHQNDAIVTVDASQIGLTEDEPMFDDGLHGDGIENDGLFGSEYLIPMVEAGEYALTVRASDPITYPTIRYPLNIKVYPKGPMVAIPAGEFQMGIGTSDPYFDNSAVADEKPLHVHPTSAYEIGKYEITVGEFAAFVEDGGYFKQQCWSPVGWLIREDMGLVEPFYWDSLDFAGQGNLNNPMVGLSWYEAQAYCIWLSAVTGETYRLPTEAEWERAARGDADDRVFPWGYSWDKEKCNNSKDTIDNYLTSVVGRYSPAGDSPWGLADTMGNAFEWTNDWYKSTIYETYAGGNYTPPSTGSQKVGRGGVWWIDSSIYFRCSFRWNKNPVDFDDGNGFRVLKEVR